VRQNWILFLFVIFIFLSGFWADVPQASFRRSLALVGTTTFAIYLAVRFHHEQVLGLLAIAFAVLIVESIILVFLAPQIGISSFHAGAWQGAVGHKNDFGRVMLLAALVFWVFSERAGRHMPLTLIFLALSGFLVIMSQSRGAWVVAIAISFVIPTAYFLRQKENNFIFRFLLVVGIVAAFLFTFLLPNFEEMIVLLGRDLTFTGRTLIWASAIEAGSAQPWLGAGYRSFWTLLGNTLMVGHGHNSFLDIWLELGFVGFGLFVAATVVLLRRAVYHMKSTDGKIGLWPILFLNYLFMLSTVTNVFPNHGTITWVLFVAIYMYLLPVSREKLEPRAARNEPQGSFT
jgi:O-antigen ligase